MANCNCVLAVVWLSVFCVSSSQFPRSVGLWSAFTCIFYMTLTSFLSMI